MFILLNQQCTRIMNKREELTARFIWLSVKKKKLKKSEETRTDSSPFLRLCSPIEVGFLISLLLFTGFKESLLNRIQFVLCTEFKIGLKHFLHVFGLSLNSLHILFFFQASYAKMHGYGSQSHKSDSNSNAVCVKLQIKV